MAYIDVKDLSKTYEVKEKKGFWRDIFRPVYKHIPAVRNISFSIERGELVGFIGPNGAGKTTTIKMLCGILWPTSGSATVDGLIPWRSRVAHVRKLGAVFGQKKSFWPELSIRENLELLGAIYRLDKARISRRIVELTQLLTLSSFIDQPFRKLSLGQQMKAELAGALIHEPQLLFLDEPTIGMDIVAKSEFMSHLKSINQRHKTTILLTSHDLHEIELLCKRILIINHGDLMYDGDLQRILPSRVKVTFTLRGKSVTKYVEKAQLKKFLVAADYDDLLITEVPIEEVIKEYYVRK